MKFLAILCALIIPPAIYFPTIAAHHDAQLEQADEQLRDADVRLEQARAAQRKLPQFHEELTRLTTELAKLRQILPPDLAVDQVRADAESFAHEKGVRLTRFEEQRPEDRETFQQVAIEMEVTGGAASTAAFFERLRNASRIYDVRSVTMRPDPTGWRTGFVVIAYAKRDAPAAQAPATAARVAIGRSRR